MTSRRKGSRRRASGYELWTATEDPWAVTKPRYATDPTDTMVHLLAAADIVRRKYPNLPPSAIAARLGYEGDAEIIALIESMFSGFLRRNRSSVRKTSRRKGSRRRAPLLRNRGEYRSGMLTDRDYMSLGDRLVRSVLSTASYKPHNKFEEDQKHWRQARIDALAALMAEGMLDGAKSGIDERDAAMHIAVDVARRNRY